MTLTKTQKSAHNDDEQLEGGWSLKNLRLAYFYVSHLLYRLPFYYL